MRSIISIVEDADDYRSKVINLQASENIVSPNVRRALSSDFSSRYSHIENGTNDYGGTGYAEELESAASEMARKVFSFDHADVRPLSGHIAAEISILSSMKRGQSFMKIPEYAGGYQGYSQKYLPDMLGIRSYDIPFDAENQAIDYDKFDQVVDYYHPSLIILGQSLFVREYDMPRIREICDRRNIILGYDASHVMGIIAGGAFQKDVAENADIMFGSTHKTFFGPQGGMIFTNDDSIWKRMQENITWKTMDNYNISRMAGVAVALGEMLAYGKEYASAVVKNSKELAVNLSKSIGIKYSDWFTQTHQIIVDEASIKKMGYDYAKFSMNLEKNGIIVDRAGRIGTAEITRMGITDMKGISDLIIDSLNGENVKDRVNKFISYMKMRYYESK